MGHLGQGKLLIPNIRHHLLGPTTSDPEKNGSCIRNPNLLAMVKLPARIFKKVESFLCIPGMAETEGQYKEVRDNEHTTELYLTNKPENDVEDIEP